MSDEEYMLHRQCMPIIRNAQPKDHPSHSILLHFCTPYCILDFSLCQSFYEGSNIAWNVSEMQIVKFKLIDKEYMMNTNISVTRKWFNRHCTQDEWNRQNIASYCKCLEVNCHSQIIIYEEYYLPFRKMKNITLQIIMWTKHNLFPMRDKVFLL